MVRKKSGGRKPYKELTFTDDYMFCKVLGSELTRYIYESVNKAKTNRRWEREYVTVAEKLREEHIVAKVEDVDTLIEKLGMTEDQACEILDIPIHTYKLFKDDVAS